MNHTTADQQLEKLTQLADVTIRQTDIGHFMASLSSGTSSVPSNTPLESINSLYCKTSLSGASGNLEIPEAQPLEAKPCSTSDSVEVAAAGLAIAIIENNFSPYSHSLAMQIAKELLQSLKLKNSSNEKSKE